MVLQNEIINKTRSTKNKKGSAHRFVENYFTNHLAKLLQDRIKLELELLEYALVITFFEQKPSSLDILLQKIK